MKKLFLLIMMFGIVLPTIAQNDTIIYIANEPQNQTICPGLFDRVLVYGLNDCYEFYWTINGQTHHENPIIINVGVGELYEIEYYGCNFICGFNIWFEDDFLHLPNPITQTVWKHQYETLQLQPVGNDSLGEPYWYEYLWSTGSTEPIIEVTEPGTYTCEMSVSCGTATRTFIVRDNVEIYRSGVDPATNKNRVLWQTTPEQAQYVSSVKVERDGMVVGTVPYTDGEFLDNIGSENAARIYRITAIASDGTECPIPSYQFGTFNTIISPDIANPNLMNFSWEDPFIEEGSPYSVVAYRIGRFNENTGEFVAIDQLSANVHLGKYNMDLFDGDYGIVAAVFNDAKRDNEELAFSNRSENEIVGVGETPGESFDVYPNPSNGVFTVEGTGMMTVTNVLGQIIKETEIDGQYIMELPQGIYFVKMGDETRKIVVE